MFDLYFINGHFTVDLADDCFIDLETLTEYVNDIATDSVYVLQNQN